MRKNKVPQTGGKPSAMAILFCVFLSITVFVIGAIVLAVMVSAGTVEETDDQPIAIAVLVISTMAGSLAAVSSRNWIVLAASATIYYLVLICINILAFDGVFPGIGWGTAAVVFGSLSAVALHMLRDVGGKKPKFKYRYR